jgi:uncharacterized protein (DUF2141 family)
MKTLLIAAAALLLLPAAALAQDTGSVTFEFATGSTSGTVRASLFSSAEAYDRGGAPVAGATAAVTPGGTVITFEGLPPGDYAMRAFHDWDDDGEMDFNPFGMPTEPYAFSNNAVGNMGPASWDRAKFRVDGDVVQPIALR